MAVPVTLDFTPPGEPNIAALRIYEAPSALGPFIQVERTTSVGTFPSYISFFTTVLANATTDWFAIAWENSAGEVSDLSAAVQGGTSSLVGEVVKRVLARDSSLNEIIVTQEAEAVIDSLGLDPYSDASVATYRELAGLTYLTMARTMIAAAVTSAASSAVNKATIGLVSFQSDTSSSSVQKTAKDVEALIDLANKYLGLSTSFVMQLDEITMSYGLTSYDHSRLIGWVGLV